MSCDEMQATREGARGRGWVSVHAGLCLEGHF